MFIVLIVYLLILSLLFISIYINKSCIESELIRDVTHILAGTWIFFLRSIDTVLIIGIPVILTLIIIQIFHIKTITNIYSNNEEKFYSLIFYSISLTFIPLLLWERKEIVIASILTLSFGDGIASIVGKRYGKRMFKNPFSKIKSIEGSLAMLTVSILSIIITLIYFGSNNVIVSIIAGIFATVIEAISPPHLDNILVPFSVVAVLGFLT